MSPRAQTAFDAAKAKPDEWEGVDVSGLTPAERQELAAVGLSLVIDRKRRTVATYPRHLRAADLRTKVRGKRTGEGTP